MWIDRNVHMKGVFEFHILRSVRDRYEFDESLFSSDGNVVFANFHAARVFAQRINEKRDAQSHPDRTIKAGHLNAMGLIDEIYHLLLRLYEEEVNPGVFSRAVGNMAASLGADKFSNVVRSFTELFPPLDVYRGRRTVEEYLEQKTGRKRHIESTLEEIILLHFANFNRAFSPFKELFDDEQLAKRTDYKKLIPELEHFFQTEKPFGPDRQFLFDFLKAPILASPNSLEGQLQFLRKRWSALLSQKILDRMLGSEDFIKEETKIALQHLGPPPPVVPNYSGAVEGGMGLYEYEQYSADVDWMPNVVLLAKNIYVWLDQLSKKYQRHIQRLDQIPDEELDCLRRWNFTSLWLIGIWERSPASQKIKQMTGNPEAVSSAYSLYEYEIARDLGGEEAFQNLRHRAWTHGVRLAGDMVPNHMGLYSRWVVERPDYFIQLSYSPFPNYRFTGANLSEHPTVQLRIEDGYWNRSDAAVVFQRYDSATGDVRYIYHGNDGTHMPWNDTAQLNFLNAEVREAVMQSIFHVARKFSIIRFDAAMTLAKKHFQRLWYPQPGTGGDIPSRADHAMSRENFDKMFPAEFWREVVDRMNREMPGTLLLAEAFWLLEGYFVRTLGMHRVYNSAFMHMMMKEENAKYRELIKNTLAYDPEILKRYVNFMSNPDEHTAVEQFGKDGKYFGVAVLMVTLPGLPMFAHGQIEGFYEKYGMEYKKAYYQESPDEELVQRHEREVFPLMNKRQLFSQVKNFEFYDAYDGEGKINENVFAYSNRAGNERVLVFFHNTYAEFNGWIKFSCPKVVSVEGSPEKKTAVTSLADALELRAGETQYYVFREHLSGLEFIREGREFHDKGFYVELKAFQCQVFLNFEEISDATGDHGRLASMLQGKGIPDIRESLRQVRLAPVVEQFTALLNSEYLEFSSQSSPLSSDKATPHVGKLDDIGKLYGLFVRSVAAYFNKSLENNGSPETFTNLLIASRKLYAHITAKSGSDKREKNHPLLFYDEPRRGIDWLLTAVWTVITSVQEGSTIFGEEGEKKNLFDELQCERLLSGLLDEHQRHLYYQHDYTGLMRIVLLYAGRIPFNDRKKTFDLVIVLLDDPRARAYLQYNTFEGKTYYSKERFEELVRWLFSMTLIRQTSHGGSAPNEIQLLLEQTAGIIGDLDAYSVASGFQPDILKAMLMKKEHVLKPVL